MMLNDTRVSSVSEFIEAVLKIRDDWFPRENYRDFWFRGVESSAFRLLPGACWRTNCPEHSLVHSFRTMAPSYVSNTPEDEWDWYYLMQHYGLPTRLLDWTENPLFSLYFALYREPRVSEATPCVWMMDPVCLNRIAYHLDENNIFVTGGHALSHWLPDSCANGDDPKSFTDEGTIMTNEMPIAIFPKRFNPRLVAQRGAFTVHGTRDVALEDVFASADKQELMKLDRLLIEPNAIEQIIKDLWTLGLSHTALFPEPESISKDLIRVYGVS